MAAVLLRPSARAGLPSAEEGFRRVSGSGESPREMSEDTPGSLRLQVAGRARRGVTAKNHHQDHIKELYYYAFF